VKVLVSKATSAFCAIGFTVAVSVAAHAATSDDAIAERLMPTGKVCLKGDPCDSSDAVVVAAEPATAALPGAAKFTTCAGCHGANGGGGLGPKLAGQSQDDIISKLTAYKNGETRGDQSSLMWAQAGGLSSQDMTELADYIGTL